MSSPTHLYTHKYILTFHASQYLQPALLVVTLHKPTCYCQYYLRALLVSHHRSGILEICAHEARLYTAFHLNGGKEYYVEAAGLSEEKNTYRDCCQRAQLHNGELCMYCIHLHNIVNSHYTCSVRGVNLHVSFQKRNLLVRNLRTKF